MKNCVNIGQIGVGYWGPNLLRNLVANNNCKVKTVVDLSSERRSYVQSLYPEIKVERDANAVFEDPDIDALVIATPVKTHYKFAMQALNANKHFLAILNVATKVEEIKKIKNLSEKKNLTAMVGHTFLFNPAVQYIKKVIDSGELGKIRYIYSQRLNLGRIRSDVDALWNLAPHDISIINFWLDNPEIIKIKRFGNSYIQKGIDDVVFLNINFSGNVMANIHVSWLDPDKIRKMSIVGSKRMLIYDDISDNKVTIYDKGIDPIASLGKKWILTVLRHKVLSKELEKYRFPT